MADLAYLIELKANVSNATKKFKKAMQEMQNSGKITGAEAQKLGAKTTSLGANMTRLASRAAMTIPIWLALRQGMMAVANAFKETIKYVLDLDTALARATAVTHGVGDPRAFRPRLTEAAGAAGKMGVGPKEALESYYLFGTAGFDAETAISGMNTALKTSIAMMGDSATTARALSGVYRLLGSTITEVESPQEKLQYIAATLVTLWEDNDFMLNEMTASLERFTAVAGISNMTVDETLGMLASLHTLMQRNTMAATGMERALLRIGAQKDLVEGFLNRGVNFDNEKPLDVLNEIIMKMRQMKEEGKSISEDVYEIFGMRGAKTVSSLVMGLEFVNKNMEKLGNKDYAARMDILNDKYKIQAETLTKLGEINKQLNLEMRNSFLETVGVQDALKSGHKSINILLEKEGVNAAKSFGSALRDNMPNLLKIIADMTSGNLSSVGEVAANFADRFGKEAKKQEDMASKMKDIYGDNKDLWPDKKDFEESQKNIAKVNELMKEQAKDFEFTAKEAAKAEKISKEQNIDFEEALRLVHERKVIIEDETEEAKAQREEWESIVNIFSDFNDTLKKQDEIQKNNLETLSETEKLEKRVTEGVEYQLLMADKLALKGFSQIDIEKEKLKLMMEQNESGKELEKQSMKIYDLELKRELAAQKTAQNMAFQFENADAIGKRDIEELFKMQDWTGEELSNAFSKNPYLAKLIKENQGFFDEDKINQVQQGILETRGLVSREGAGIDGGWGGLAEMPKNAKQMALQIMEGHFPTTVQGVEVTVNLNGASLKNFGEEVGEALLDYCVRNSALTDRLTEALRDNM